MKANTFSPKSWDSSRDRFSNGSSRSTTATTACVSSTAQTAAVNESTLSRANEKRDCLIYEGLGVALMKIVQPMYSKMKIDYIVPQDYELLALDSTTIPCSVKLMAWALGKYSKGAVKMHTLIDLRGSIPVFIHITDGRCHDSNILDILEIVANAIYTMDKAYVDFEGLFRIDSAHAFFVTRAKDNMKYETVSSNFNIDPKTGLVGDHAYLLLARIKAVYDSPYSITEIGTLIKVYALTKKDLKSLVTEPQPLIQNQDVNELTLFD